MPTGVVSSSVKPEDDCPSCPSADALRGGMPVFDGRARPLLLGSPGVARTLCENLFDVGLPYRGGFLGAGVAIEGRGPGVICSLRTGESGRGSEVLGFFPIGLGARPGPTDWLNLGNDGVGGV